MVPDLEAALARGFRAFKLGWGRFMRTGNPADDEAIIRTTREMVGDGEIMVDPGGSQQFWAHNFKTALRTADMLADYGVVWFEEALPPDDLEGFKLLRAQSRVMISSGEVLTRRQSFQPFLEQGALDLVQPDCTKVGGITEAKHIAWMAYNHNILTVPHGWNTAIGLAADLHLVAALPTGKWVEYPPAVAGHRRGGRRAVPDRRRGDAARAHGPRPGAQPGLERHRKTVLRHLQARVATRSSTLGRTPRIADSDDHAPVVLWSCPSSYEGMKRCTT